MKSNFKQFLYTGLIATSVLGISAFATISASAKSGTYITKKAQLTTAPEKRNVVPSGDNALYTKVGTLTGSRVVASKATMQKLLLSNKSANTFRAYAVATTNRGSVYYKVVSFNGKYRGWIYGGKNVGRFVGGIQSFDTTDPADAPTIKSGYTLVNPSKWTLWNNPQYTQYKASKVKGFSNTDTFTVTGAESKNPEGWVYYQVKDEQDPSITGWVYSLGVQAPQGNSVKISYVDKATGKEVGTGSVTFDKGDATTDLTTGSNFSSIYNGIPSGYAISGSGAAAFLNATLATSAKNNETIAVYVGSTVDPTSTTAVTIIPYTLSGTPITMTAHDRDVLTVAGRNYDLQITKGQSFAVSDIERMIRSVGLETLTDQSGHKYTLQSADAVPGSQTTTGVFNAKAYYKAN